MNFQSSTESDFESSAIPLGALPEADIPNTTYLQDLCGQLSGKTVSLAQLRHAETLFSQYYVARCQEFLSDGKIHISVRTDSDVRQLARRIVTSETREDILREAGAGGGAGGGGAGAAGERGA